MAPTMFPCNPIADRLNLHIHTVPHNKANCVHNSGQRDRKIPHNGILSRAEQPQVKPLVRTYLTVSAFVAS